MIDRINLILQAKNITARQFAEEIGIQPSSISHILSGRNNPSLDFVMKLVTRYPEINIDWLLFGKGAMYNSSDQSTTSNSTSSISLSEKDSSSIDVDSSVKSYQEIGEEPNLFSGIDDDTAINDNNIVGANTAVDNKVADANNVVDNNKIVGANNVVNNNDVDTNNAVGVNNAIDDNVIDAGNVVAEGKATDNNATDDNVVTTQKVDSTHLDASIKPLVTKDDIIIEKDNRMSNTSITASKVQEENVHMDCKQVETNKKLIKIILLYDDHSFSEYHPE